MSHEAVRRITAPGSAQSPLQERKHTGVSAPHVALFGAALKRAGALRSARDGERSARNVSARQEDADELAAADGMSLTRIRARTGPDGDGQRGQRGQGEQQSAAQAWSEQTAARLASSVDATAMLVALAPCCENDGLFELILPDGTLLSAAVTVTARAIRILFAAPAPTLAARLRRTRTELQQRLQRRTGKDVAITVL